MVASLTLFAGTPEGLWRSPDWGATWTRVVGPAPGGHPGIARSRARARAPGPAGLGRGRGRALPLGRLRARLEAPLRRGQRAVRHALALSPVGSHRLHGDRFRAPALRRLGPDLQAHRPQRRHRFAARVAGPRAGRGHEPGRAHLRGRGTASSATGAWACPTGEVQALAVSSFFAVDPVLFAGGAFGVYRSADGGRTWKAAGLTGRSIFDLVWLGPFLYATGDGGVVAERRQRADLDAAVRGPGDPAGSPADVPIGPGCRPRGLRGHRRRDLPHPRRRPALAKGRSRRPPDLVARHLSGGAALPQQAQEVKFAKAHGLGNDFILVAAAEGPSQGISELGATAMRPPHRRGRRRGHPLRPGSGRRHHAPLEHGRQRRRDLRQRPALSRGSRRRAGPGPGPPRRPSAPRSASGRGRAARRPPFPDRHRPGCADPGERPHPGGPRAQAAPGPRAQPCRRRAARYA